MTDMSILKNKVTRGKEAERILDSWLFREVAESIRKDCFSAFKGDDEERSQAARVEIRAFEALLTKFGKIHQDGLSAHKRIQDLRKRDQEGLSNDPNDLQGIA